MWRCTKVIERSKNFCRQVIFNTFTDNVCIINFRNKNILFCRYTTSRSQTFYGLPVHDTIKRLLILGDLKNAEKKRTEYKVPEKRFWWLRIQVLSETYQWEELEKFSKAKKSPIGYEPFVEVCLKQNNVEEAKKYLSKCRNDKKIKWYIRAG